MDNFLEKIKVVKAPLVILGIALASLEFLQSYFIVDAVQKLLSGKQNEISVGLVVVAIAVTFAIPVTNYIYYLLSTKFAVDQVEPRKFHESASKPYQKLITTLRAYTGVAPAEVYNRIALGVYAAFNLFLGRLSITLLLMVYLALSEPSFSLFLISVALPALLIVFLFNEVQRRIGTRVTGWINDGDVFVSKMVLDLIRLRSRPKQILESFRTRNFDLAKNISASQSVSNSYKSFIELSLFLVLLYASNAGALTQAISNPAIIAVLYRLYGNAFQLVSLYSLFNFSYPALKDFKKFTYDVEVTRKISKKLMEDNSNIEIRGDSGSGKSTLLERLACDYRADKAICYLNSEFMPDELMVGELIDISDLKMSNLNGVNEKMRVRDLSLGQKKSVLLEIARQGDFDIYIIDEPLSNLDDQNKTVALNVLMSLKRKVIITNHDQHVSNFRAVDLTRFNLPILSGRTNDVAPSKTSLNS